MNGRKPLQSDYDLKSVNLPYLSGLSLRLFLKILEDPLRGLLISRMLREGGIPWLRKQRIDETPTFYPMFPTGTPAAGPGSASTDALPAASDIARSGFRFTTIHDLAGAYREGRTSPVDVARRVLEAIEAADAADPPLRAFIAVDREAVLKQAEAATARLDKGQALSMLDGVPVAVKDELDMVPHPTTLGTAFLGTAPAKEDATVVARLRAAGALLIGKANMHEAGAGTTGLNHHHGTARNPYHPAHYTGGSSSGPAAAVAAGFCPVAAGSDGGGSIRIPAAFCGLVGLKPTFGRISAFGQQSFVLSVNHLGPLAATAVDAALAYTVMAGPDPKYPLSMHQPAPTLEGWNEPDLSDLVLGVYRPWFRHAGTETVSACEALLNAFENRGAAVREIAIPDLEACRIAHMITIVGEMAQSLDRHQDIHRDRLGADARVALAVGRAYTGRDYIQAQRVRTRMIAHFSRVLEQVDAIITPTTPDPAPVIPTAALKGGDLDMTLVTEVMRFVVPANLTGLPAISFPAGYSDAGLPIGMQAMGRAWQEHTLLRLALAAEGIVERKAPRIFHRIMED